MTEVEIIEKINELRQAEQIVEVKAELERLVALLEPVREQTRGNAFLDECAG